MAVGVPENDVFAAADAVLARGQRPTVERVRLELGRGSPARVGALLDQWWEQLAGRLRGETRLPELPTEVAQAFVAIWQQATTMAQGVVEQSVAGQRQVLMEEREQLAMLETRAGLEAAQARQKAAEAEATRQVMETRLADQEQLSDQRQAQIRDLQHQRDRLLQERSDALLRSSSLEQELQALRHEVEQARIQQESYLRSVEDRSYREIDRAREESKGFATQLKQANLQLVGRQQQLEVVHAELSEARQQAASQRSRADILSEQLMLQSSSKPSSKPKIRNRATMASTRKT